FEKSGDRRLRVWNLLRQRQPLVTARSRGGEQSPCSQDVRPDVEEAVERVVRPERDLLVHSAQRLVPSAVQECVVDAHPLEPAEVRQVARPFCLLYRRGPQWLPRLGGPFYVFENRAIGEPPEAFRR